MARLRADEHEELHGALDASFAKWPGQGIFLQRFFELGARVDIDLYRGEGARAHDRVLAIWDRLRRSQLLRSHGMYTEAHYIRGRAAIAAGRLDDARKTAKRLAGSDAPVHAIALLHPAVEAFPITDDATVVERFRRLPFQSRAPPALS